MTTPFLLITILQVCAAVQMAVAVLNLFLVRLLKWKGDLLRMSLLPRQVFHVHLWFITVTLLIFGALTWRFAGEMVCGSNSVAQWLAGSIAVFWGTRTVMQVVYYSPKHWWGKPAQTLVHVMLLASYGGLTAAYVLVVI